MGNQKACEGDYLGEKAIWLQWGRFEAALLPDTGGNLIAFRDVETGFRFLHEPAPDDIQSFKTRPFIYGIPVLFPPNRYEDGRFLWEDKTYVFPINEPETGNHLHGFLYDIPWSIDDYGCSKTESYVSVSIKIDKNHAVYEHFPHQFTIRLKYALDENGLSQHLLIRNDGEEKMPCLLAFHTSINAPFDLKGSAKDYRLKITIGDRWELNERMLPTLRFQPLTAEERQLRDEGVYPFYEVMDNHYTAVPQNGRNRMELTDMNCGVTLVYDVGTSYKSWMVCNKFYEEGFFFPEPQINLVNAPNVKLPAEQIGLYGLNPGEIWEETSRLYIKQSFDNGKEDKTNG